LCSSSTSIIEDRDLSAHLNILTIRCALNANTTANEMPRLSKTTGNQRLDLAFINEYNILASVFGVRPSLYIVDDSRAPNAFAVPQAFEPGYQGSVAFGYQLMTEEFRSSPTNFTIPAIMAHEFGHIVQFAHGVTLPTQLMELQADYISGWYMRNRDAQSGWSAESAQQTLKAFYSKGDYEFNNPDHHGTPQERLKAASAGMNDLSGAISSVLDNGYRFVTQTFTSGGGESAGRSSRQITDDDRSLRGSANEDLVRSLREVMRIANRDDPDRSTRLRIDDETSFRCVQRTHLACRATLRDSEKAKDIYQSLKQALISINRNCKISSSNDDDDILPPLYCPSDDKRDIMLTLQKSSRLSEIEVDFFTPRR